ncbi:hypothetical protein GCM10020229_49750 [Kitasatospora albolonga]
MPLESSGESTGGTVSGTANCGITAGAPIAPGTAPAPGSAASAAREPNTGLASPAAPTTPVVIAPALSAFLRDSIGSPFPLRRRRVD